MIFRFVLLTGGSLNAFTNSFDVTSHATDRPATGGGDRHDSRGEEENGEAFDRCFHVIGVHCLDIKTVCGGIVCRHGVKPYRKKHAATIRYLPFSPKL